MLTIHTAKNLHGKFELPPSTDLFFVALVTSLCRRQPLTIAEPPESPLITSWEESFSGLCTFEKKGTAMVLLPVCEDQAVRIPFASPDLPWRDFTVFALLGMRKTIVFRHIHEKRIEAWQRQLRRFGCSLEVTPWESSICLSIADEMNIPAKPDLDETDFDAFIGLLMGAGHHCSFSTPHVFLSPLRLLAPLFGYTLEVKSTTPRERDSLVRRIQFMQQKGRKQSSGSQQYQIIADFTLSNEQPDQPIAITLPGDAVLGTVFSAAKCLYPKSSFVIGNMPLESWATPLFSFIRKMGCKVSVQETGRTSFGSQGIIQIQSGELYGRKCECKPSSRHMTALPALVIVASFARGESVFRELADLRYDEPDGIDELESCIRLLGARHGEMPDGIVLQGNTDFDGFDIPAPVPPYTAAAFSIAATRCSGASTINDARLAAVYPQFATYLEQFFEYRKPDEKN